MLALLLALTLLSPLPPVGLHAERYDGRVLLSWSQQSDANVVCVRRQQDGSTTPLGCFASVPGFNWFDSSDAPSGTDYFVQEWYRDAAGGWTMYGEYGPATLPYQAFVPLVRR